MNRRRSRSTSLGCRAWVATLALVVACAPSSPRSGTPVAANAPREASDAGAGLSEAGDDAGASASADDAGPPSLVEGPAATPKSPDDAKACATTAPNIERSVAAILAASAASSASSASSASHGRRHPAWDHVTPPARLDLVEKRFALEPAELARLRELGFVVPARLAYDDYPNALHDIYRSELPLYLSADAIFHAVYVSNDKLIAEIEREQLKPRLKKALAALHDKLAGAVAAGAFPEENGKDLDVYLTVAEGLLAGAAVPSRLKTDAEAAKLMALATKGNAMVEVTLFGRPRIIDFTQYGPRGHYTGALATYFRAAMWLSRLELNLVSRSSRSSQPGEVPNPAETPREATDALALADLAERAAVMDDIDALDRAWTVLAGRREDVTVRQLAALRKKADITSLADADVAAAKLKAAIGADFQRTARLHYMPQGSTVLPAIATLLGPRVVADTSATTPLVHAVLPGRGRATMADMAYAMGLDHAKTLLTADLTKYPTLAGQLEKSRAIVQGNATGTDLYGTWFAAIRAVSDKPEGALPSFWDTPAYSDLRFNTMTAAFAQLKHNYVLLVGQPYTEGGCEIPDSFVEPVPRVYERLAAYADAGLDMAKELWPKGDPAGAQAYFTRLGRLLRTLEAIARRELDDEPLTPEMQRFLSQVVELEAADNGTGYFPSYRGWYFQLFWKGEAEAFERGSLVADWMTNPLDGEIAYVGTRGPRLGVFVVDVAGAPRVVVGPTARAYEHVTPLGARLTDRASRKLPESALSEPWARSYTVAAEPEPPLVIGSASLCKSSNWNSQSDAPAGTLEVRSNKDLGAVTIELLDHHQRPVASVTKKVGKATTTFQFAGRSQWVRAGTWAVEGVHIKVGASHTYVDTHSGRLPDVALGSMRSN